jgi:hypothetical protein
LSAVATRKKPAPEIEVRGPFVSEGPIEWAMLAPAALADLEKTVFGFRHRRVVRSMWDLDAPRSWCVRPGTKQHRALIETAPGSTGSGTDLAKELSRACDAAVYLVELVGYDDPDRGLPSITRFDRGKQGLVWMAPYDDDDAGLAPKTVAGPRGVPCDDPFDFAAALGCDLRKLA